MYVIGIYDMNTETKEGRKRLQKMLKIFRIYLHHVQKSVFEGEISESSCEELKQKIQKNIDPDKDTVILFKMNNPKWIEKDFFGYKDDVTSNIL